MATLKCLACGHDNKVGDASCASCASSLNLKLCSACEAVNANGAERCHSCGAEFGPQAAVPADLEHAVAFVEIPPPEKSLPAMRRSEDEPRSATRSRRSMALWLLPVALTAGAAAYYFHGWPYPAPTASTSTAVAPEAPTESAAAPAQPAETIGKSGKPANGAVAQSTPAAEAKRALSSVTHTRAAPAAAPAAEPQVSKKRAVAEPQVSKKRPAASAAANPVAAAAVTAGSPPALEAAAPAYSRVTHTKAPEPGEAPASVPPPPRAVPLKDQSAGCAPGVGALGLCISK